jgi:putative hemolysin
MSTSLWIEIAITFIFFLANAFFAAAEIAIVSARRSRLQQMIDDGQKSAKQALELAENPDRFLATVQVGMTLINTLAAAFGGASFSGPLATLFALVPFFRPYANTLALASVVALVAYFSLVLGELVPKRLALQSAESLATRTAPFMTNLAVVLKPAIGFLNFSTTLVLRMIGQGQARKSSVTEEDIVYLAREGAVSGTVESEEEEFINRVFRFTDRVVDDVMQPRTDIVAVELGTPLQEVIETLRESGFTRLPLYEDSLDNIIGVLYAKDLLLMQIKNESTDLKKLARPPFFVTAYQHVDDLLTMFRSKGIHMAIVIDEYSQVVGLLTLEDVLEELVGEIQDEYDEPEHNAFVARADGSWLVDAMVPQEDVREKLKLLESDGGQDRGYRTLAGMMLAYMGRIPKVGDSVAIDQYVFEVVDMDGRRIDKVLIRPLESMKSATRRLTE